MLTGRQDKTRGFTLVELIAGLLITALIGLGAVMFFNAVARAVNRPVITFGGSNYALAPILRDSSDGVAKTDLLDALDLHKELSGQIGSADMVAVFGGTNLNPGAPAALQPLVSTFANFNLPSLSGASPQSLLSTSQLATAAATDFAGLYDLSANSGDFTVLVFQGVNELTAIVQVRRYTTTFEGQTVALYETTMRSRTLPTAAWRTYAYRFWLPADEDTWAVPVGARHYWYRHEANWWGRSEPTGSTLVFPDPYTLAATASDALVKPMSRFSYFISTSPY